MAMSWAMIRLQADLLRLDVDVAAMERLAAEASVPSGPDARAEVAWAGLMAKAGARA